jgi:hypothetical protein
MIQSAPKTQPNTPIQETKSVPIQNQQLTKPINNQPTGGAKNN